MREPTFSGPAKVWEMEVDPTDRSAKTTVAAYVVNGPYHPFWSWWMVAVVHLRPVEGEKPAHKRYPEAEYEFIILSIDPEQPDPDPDKPLPQDFGFLDPPDAVVQFHGVDDAGARDICRYAARAIAHGISCDSDLRAWWEGAIERTAEHYRAGLHGSPSE